MNEVPPAQVSDPGRPVRQGQAQAILLAALRTPGLDRFLPSRSTVACRASQTALGRLLVTSDPRRGRAVPSGEAAVAHGLGNHSPQRPRAGIAVDPRDVPAAEICREECRAIEGEVGWMGEQMRGRVLEVDLDSLTVR